jgi:cyclopropane-fatty-acyl-phospholipid synthase
MECFAPASAQDFEIITHHKRDLEWLLQADAYSAARAFVNGQFEVQGDFIAAVRFQLSRSGAAWRRDFLNAICRWSPWRLTQRWAGAAGTARYVRFHYDRSNDFYQLFLDAQMVYSCAYYNDPEFSLDQAQDAKLNHICRKLDLQPGDRFLDMGCGWGGLALKAAQDWGVSASGCTLSHQQFEYASRRVRDQLLEHQVSIQEADYRETAGEFDKISSIGMFEQVGRANLEAYFRKVYSLLAADGLFLNHGITRPAPVHSDAQSLFLTRNVFPGIQVLNLHEVVRAAERAGFEVLDVENLRRHYARTCRDWVDRLTANRERCLKTVDASTWRTWLLYLAGSVVAFETGDLGLHQILLAKRGANSAAPATRDYMYRKPF